MCQSCILRNMENISKVNGRWICNGLKKVVSPKKNHLTSVLENVEGTLNDKKKKCVDKVQSLVSAWDLLCRQASESPQPEFDVLFTHTIRFVLKPDWQCAKSASQTHLSVTINRFSTSLTNSKRYPSILKQSRLLESIVKNPWSHDVLSEIVSKKEVEFFDLLNFFQFENGKVIVIRLEMLLNAKIEDMASNLSKVCLQTYYNSEPLELDFSQDELDYITDIYFCTLYKQNKFELTHEIKTYELDEGVDLLRRYREAEGIGRAFNRNCREARVWKYGIQVTELVANTLLANAVIHSDLVDSNATLQDLIREWAYVHRSIQENDFFPVALEMIEKLVIIAGSSKCIYPLCSFLIENCDSKECYMDHVARCIVRAINLNMNEIEQCRVNGEQENLREMYNQLSEGFIFVSRLFSDHVNIYKECLLTSFSLTPSSEGLQQLEALIDNVLSILPAPVLGSVVKALKTEENTLMSGGRIIENLHDQSSNEMVSKIEPQNNILPTIKNAFGEMSGNKVNALKASEANIGGDLEVMKEATTGYYAEVESLNVDDSLKIDLNSILRYQRSPMLSWELEWNELKENLGKYMDIFRSFRFDEVELKFLDLDYNQFKDVPINDDDYIGIEKGYEQYMPDPENFSDDDLSSSCPKLCPGPMWNPRKHKKRYKKKLQFVIYEDFSDVEDLFDFIRTNEVNPQVPAPEAQPVKKKKSKSRKANAESEVELPTPPSDAHLVKKKEVKAPEKANDEDEIKPPILVRDAHPKQKKESMPSKSSDENEAQSSVPTSDAHPVKKKKPKTPKTNDGKVKQNRGRPCKNSAFSVSENVDSQSENQPPDVNSNSSVNTLQKLREFRINVNLLNSEENVDASKGIEDVNPNDIYRGNDDLKQLNGVCGDRLLKVRITKCDNKRAKDNDAKGTVILKHKSVDKSKTSSKDSRFESEDKYKSEVPLSKVDNTPIQFHYEKLSQEEQMDLLDRELSLLLGTDFSKNVTVQCSESISTSVVGECSGASMSSIPPLVIFSTPALKKRRNTSIDRSVAKRKRVKTEERNESSPAVRIEATPSKFLTPYFNTPNSNPKDTQVLGDSRKRSIDTDCSNLISYDQVTNVNSSYLQPQVRLSDVCKNMLGNVNLGATSLSTTPSHFQTPVNSSQNSSSLSTVTMSSRPMEFSTLYNVLFNPNENLEINSDLKVVPMLTNGINPNGASSIRKLPTPHTHVNGSVSSKQRKTKKNVSPCTNAPVTTVSSYPNTSAPHNSYLSQGHIGHGQQNQLSFEFCSPLNVNQNQDYGNKFTLNSNCTTEELSPFNSIIVTSSQSYNTTPYSNTYSQLTSVSPSSQLYVTSEPASNSVSNVGHVNGIRTQSASDNFLWSRNNLSTLDVQTDSAVINSATYANAYNWSADSKVTVKEDGNQSKLFVISEGDSKHISIPEDPSHYVNPAFSNFFTETDSDHNNDVYS